MKKKLLGLGLGVLVAGAFLAVTASAKSVGRLYGNGLTIESGGTVSLPAGALSASTLATGAVTTAKVDSDAITSAKILDGAVTTPKLATNSVTTAKLYLDQPSSKAACVTTAKILGTCSNMGADASCNCS